MVENRLQEREIGSCLIRVVSERFAERMTTDLVLDPDFPRRVVQYAVRLEAGDWLRAFPRREQIVIVRKRAFNGRLIALKLALDGVIDAEPLHLACFLFADRNKLLPADVSDLQAQDVGDPQPGIDADNKQQAVARRKNALHPIDLFAVANRLDGVH